MKKILILTTFAIIGVIAILFILIITNQKDGSPVITVQDDDNNFSDETDLDSENILPKQITAQYKNIAGVDPDMLSLDMYFPEEVKESYPVIVFVHGGAWQIGDKANDASFLYKASHFTKKSYIYVSVNYRLSAPEGNGVVFPMHNQDVASAIKYLFDNASDYRIDTSRIILMGHSAGGHLVALNSTDQTYLNEVGLSLSDIRCTISIDTDGYDVTESAPKAPKTYYPPFGKDQNIWRKASPINHVSSGKDIPSFLVITRGDPARIGRAFSFSESINDAGSFSEIASALSYNHSEINNAVGNPGDTIVTPRIDSFLDRYCVTPRDFNPPQCTSFTYTDWSPCIKNVQIREVVSFSPSSCVGGKPVLYQSCGDRIANPDSNSGQASVVTSTFTPQKIVGTAGVPLTVVVEVRNDVGIKSVRPINIPKIVTAKQIEKTAKSLKYEINWASPVVRNLELKIEVTNGLDQIDTISIPVSIVKN